MPWGLVPEEEDYSLKGKYDEPSWLPTETVAPKAYEPTPTAPGEEKKPEAAQPSSPPSKPEPKAPPSPEETNRRAIQSEQENSLSRLSPDVQPYVRNLLGALTEHFKNTGIEVRIHSGYRSPQEQEELYRVGRRGIKGEEVITNARGGQSEHQGGRAVDIGLYRNGQYIGDPKDPLYKEIGSVGEKLGFTWGGKFKSIYDPAHFQLPQGAPTITTEVRKGEPVNPQGVKDQTYAVPPQSLAPGSDLRAKLVEARKRFGSEIDERTKQLLMASTMAEVGDQPDYTKQAYIESVMNRAVVEGRPLRDVLLDPQYYPDATKNRLGRTFSGATHDRLADLIAVALNGSNISNLATGNESGNVHSGGAPVVFNPRTGERFVRENWTLGWMGEPREVSEAPGQYGPISHSGPAGHDTAPDGTRPMGAGRYIWPGEPGDPSQPAGEGKYIWPGAQRASPEEIESARYGPFRNPFRGPLAETAPLDPQTAIAEASGFPWPQAEPVHGYTPAPTPMSVYGYNPSPIAPPQPQGVTAQYPFEFGIAPPGQQADQYRYGTGTLPPDYGTKPPAQAAPAPVAPVAAPAAAPAPQESTLTLTGAPPTLTEGPTPEVAAAPTAAPQLAPGELAQSRNPGEQLTSYLNMLNRGMTSEGILSMIEGLDALALHHLPDWKVLDWLRDNLRSEQKQTAFLRNKLRQDVFPVDRATTESKVGQVLQVLGQAVPTVGIGGAAGGGGKLAAGIVTGLQAAGQLFDEARQDAFQHGASEEQANKTATQYLVSAGVFEYISDRYLLGRFLEATGAGKLTLREIAKAFGKGGALEGVTEPAQQAILNFLAKGNYDPDRPLGKDVLDSAIVGIFGGGLGAGGAHIAGHVAGKIQKTQQQAELQEGLTALSGLKAEDVGPELTPEEKEAFKKAGVEPAAPPETKPPEAEAAPPTPPPEAKSEGEIKPSLAMPETPAAPETVKVQAFDPKTREFVEAEMKPTKELHEQLKREENSYNALIKCLEL